MITGNPVSRRVVPLVPPLLSYSSTCSRTQSRGLGTYLAMGFDLPIAVGSLPPRSLCTREKCRPAPEAADEAVFTGPALQPRAELVEARLEPAARPSTGSCMDGARGVEEFGVDAKWGASHVFGLLLRH